MHSQGRSGTWRAGSKYIAWVTRPTGSVSPTLTAILWRVRRISGTLEHCSRASRPSARMQLPESWWISGSSPSLNGSDRRQGWRRSDHDVVQAGLVPGNGPAQLLKEPVEHNACEAPH